MTLITILRSLYECLTCYMTLAFIKTQIKCHPMERSFRLFVYSVKLCSQSASASTSMTFLNGSGTYFQASTLALPTDVMCERYRYKSMIGFQASTQPLTLTPPLTLCVNRPLTSNVLSFSRTLFVVLYPAEEGTQPAAAKSAAPGASSE